MKKDENKETYSISEFAKACGTTKDTLYHYEKQGILIPEMDENNHYRYYSLSDFHLFQYIAHLRRLGLSISEIRECVKERNVQTYLGVLARSQKRLLDEIAEAKRRYDIVTKTREAAFEFTHVLLETPKIEYSAEEYYFSSSFQGKLNSLDGIVQLRNHLSTAEKMPEITNNLIVFKYDPKARQLLSSRPSLHMMIQASNPKSINEEHLHVKPAGFYLHIYFHMDLPASTVEERERCYRKIEDYVQEHNYQIVTDLYCYNHISKFLTDDPKEFLAEFVIGVE
ncbi:MAG: MerR family transcriptional regulator [Parasporobacterium sp.]|nr:MerR family transcriptional regulator [Parasporobacterium sp.]